MWTDIYQNLSRILEPLSRIRRRAPFYIFRERFFALSLPRASFFPSDRPGEILARFLSIFQRGLTRRKMFELCQKKILNLGRDPFAGFGLGKGEK